MPSFYENALGSDFKKLHPKIQEKFSMSTEDHKAIFCKGVMEEISGPSWVVQPVKKFGTDRHLIFPERGRNIPRGRWTHLKYFQSVLICRKQTLFCSI